MNRQEPSPDDTQVAREEVKRQNDTSPKIAK